MLKRNFGLWNGLGLTAGGDGNTDGAIIYLINVFFCFRLTDGLMSSLKHNVLLHQQPKRKGQRWNRKEKKAIWNFRRNNQTSSKEVDSKYKLAQKQLTFAKRHNVTLLWKRNKGEMELIVTGLVSGCFSTRDIYNQRSCFALSD